MKEFYIAPVAERVGFVSDEKLANFDDLLNGGGGVIPGPGQEAQASDGDITLEDFNI